LPTPIYTLSLHDALPICHFQKSKEPYEDEHFQLLLVRLLIDAFHPFGWKYQVPALDELIKGVTDPGSRVTYVKLDTRQHYPRFRSEEHTSELQSRFDLVC